MDKEALKGALNFLWLLGVIGIGVLILYLFLRLKAALRDKEFDSKYVPKNGVISTPAPHPLGLTAQVMGRTTLKIDCPFCGEPHYHNRREFANGGAQSLCRRGYYTVISETPSPVPVSE